MGFKIGFLFDDEKKFRLVCHGVISNITLKEKNDY